jgi:hypothetical protein
MANHSRALSSLLGFFLGFNCCSLFGYLTLRPGITVRAFEYFTALGAFIAFAHDDSVTKNE